MAWTIPLYDRAAVREAGTSLIDPDATAEEREQARSVVNNWRSSHGYPLNTLQINLRHNARAVFPQALIAQRLKRTVSIDAKLRRFPNLPLTEIQDLGGCRAVVRTVRQIDRIAERFRKSRSKQHLYNCDDYLRHPKKSGYRGMHLMFEHFSDKRPEFNRHRIEVQLRTRPQHAWATAVETVGLFTGQALKASQGDEEWLRFFAVMSSQQAIRERLPTIPGTPTDRAALRAELRDLTESLKAIQRLQAYGAALLRVDRVFPNAYFFLLELDAPAGKLQVEGYTRGQREVAALAYEAMERAIAGRPGVDAVLVAADSVVALRKAYPNYFADTTAFVRAVKQAIQ